MADITVTIPTTQVSRVSEALGVSTVAEAKAWVMAKIKEEVIAYEIRQAEEAEEAKVQTAREAQRTAIGTARTTAEVEVILT